MNICLFFGVIILHGFKLYGYFEKSLRRSSHVKLHQTQKLLLFKGVGGHMDGHIGLQGASEIYFQCTQQAMKDVGMQCSHRFCI